MADDIFDQAAKAAPQKNGDVFDQATPPMSEADQVAQRPDAIAQARKVKPAGLIETRRAMQQTMGGPPMFTDVPAQEKDSFESAGQRGYATGAKVGAASLALPSLYAAPVPTALSLLGGAAGGYAGGAASKAGAKALGASDYDAETAEDVGGAIGGIAGGYGASKLPSSRNDLASLLRNPATARQSQLGRPGTVKNLPSIVQKYTPDWLIPKGDLGTPTNPGQFSEIPARAPLAARDPVSFAVKQGTASRVPTKMPKAPLAVPTPSPVKVGPEAPLTEPSEGRPATWTNETVSKLAPWGDPDAMAQQQKRMLGGEGRVPLAYSPADLPSKPLGGTFEERMSGGTGEEAQSQPPLIEEALPKPKNPLAIRQRVAQGESPTGTERRTQAQRDYSLAIQSTPPGSSTPGEDLAQQIRTARAGQPSGVSEAQALQRIMQDQDTYDAYRNADQKTRDAMLVKAKNEMAAAQK